MKPIQVKIKDLNGIEIGGFSKDTLEEANEYLALIDAKPRPWHRVKQGEYSELPEGALNYTEKEVENLDGSKQTIYVVPKQYTWKIQDLTNDYNFLLQKCYEDRKKHYPQIEDLVVAMFEKDYEKIADLENQRKLVKQQFAKPIGNV